jgi:hypothetical protein
MDGGHEDAAINLHREYLSSAGIIELFRKYEVPEKFDHLTGAAAPGGSQAGAFAVRHEGVARLLLLGAFGRRPLTAGRWRSAAAPSLSPNAQRTSTSTPSMCCAPSSRGASAPARSRWSLTGEGGGCLPRAAPHTGEAQRESHPAPPCRSAHPAKPRPPPSPPPPPGPPAPPRPARNFAPAQSFATLDLPSESWATSKSCYFGASGLAFERLLRAHRYSLIAWDAAGVNLVFVADDELGGALPHSFADVRAAPGLETWNAIHGDCTHTTWLHVGAGAALAGPQWLRHVRPAVLGHAQEGCCMRAFHEVSDTPQVLGVRPRRHRRGARRPHTPPAAWGRGRAGGSGDG